jgi:hypothetical protein
MKKTWYDGNYNSNDEDEYLAKGRNGAKKEMGEKKGNVSKGNYGSRNGTDNVQYSDRGLETPDDRKIDKQKKPNDRMYMYVQ